MADMTDLEALAGDADRRPTKLTDPQASLLAALDCGARTLVMLVSPGVWRVRVPVAGALQWSEESWTTGTVDALTSAGRLRWVSRASRVLVPPSPPEAPLSSYAIRELTRIERNPVPYDSFNRGTAERFVKDGLAITETLRSAYPHHNGRRMLHLQITAEGLALLAKEGAK